MKALDIQAFLEKLLTRVAGIRHIVVSDEDGVIIYHAPNSVKLGAHLRLYQRMAVVSAFTREQTSKLDTLGPTEIIVNMYVESVIVHAFASPLVIIVEGVIGTNTGELLDLIPILKDTLEPTRCAIERSLKDLQSQPMTTNYNSVDSNSDSIAPYSSPAASYHP